MTIYYIRKGEEGPIKIGYTKSSAEHRMKQLQTGHHERLHLLGTSPGLIADEKSIHKELEAYRFCGEWFDPRPELMFVINDMVKNQHPWYFIRTVRFHSVSGERAMLEDLFKSLHEELASEKAKLQTKINNFNSIEKTDQLIERDVLIRELTKLRQKNRDLAELVESQKKEIGSLKLLQPVGTGRAASRGVAHPVASLGDIKQFSLQL